MKTVKIDTNLWEDVQSGDRLEINRENCTYLAIRVEDNRGELYITEKSMGRPTSDRRTYLTQVPKDWELRSIVRPASTDKPALKPKWKFSEIFKQDVIPARPKVGSQEAIQEAIESTDSIVDYFDTRVQMGDPLFDQWMVDAHESAKASSDNLRKLLKVMKGDE